MSHQIVECPGCLTKLRVREATKTIQLQCPRCGELLAIDPPEPAPKPAPTPPVSAPPQKRPTEASSAAQSPAPPKRPAQQAAPAPASRPKPASRPTTSKPTRKPAKKEEPDYDDPWSTDSCGSDETYEDAPAPRRRTAAASSSKKSHGLLVGILAGGGVALIGVAIFAVISFTRSSGSGIAVAPTSVASAETSGLVPPDGNNGAISGVPLPGSALPGQAGLAPPTTTPPGSPVAPNASADAGNSVPAPAAISGDSRKLRYHWKPGAEFMYQFTVEEGSGEEVRKTTGVCSYRVQGDSRRVETEEEGTGTGFVVSSDGIIATCAHVVEGSKRMEVHLNGQTYPATVIAVDPKSDVAMIRINATGLSALTLSDSEAVQLAESVRAIGYPLSDVLGTDVKVTTGTVAGIVQSRERGKQIQIDAAINPGNSGGPVVNGAGQVIGVASAKLSGSSVTSVGFAAPVNQLRALASANGLQLPIAARGVDLAGPEVARRVTPGVAYIKVWGSSGGRMYEVSYNANFHQQPQMRSMRGRFPGPPSFGSSSMDDGKLTVNGLGEVLDFTGSEQLPAVLGPVGVFFLEPLDAYSESQWHVETESKLQRIKRDDGPFGGMGPRMGGRMRGFAPPGFAPPGFGGGEDQVLEEIPAVERVTYQVGQALNNKVSIAKNYEYTATRSNNQPYLTIRGSGTIVFDTVQGMPASLEYTANVEQTDETGVVRVPVRVNYTLRDAEEVKREREQMAQKIEADKKQKNEERTVPNPKLVDDLIAEVRKAEGGIAASQPLGRLGQIAVVEEKRADVIRLATNHMKNSNGFVKKSATEAFCHWATAEHAEELHKVLADSDGLMHEAKKRAVGTLAKIAKPADYPTLIMSVTDSVVRNDVKEALIAIGPAIEKPILENFSRIGDSASKNELLEVLKKVGTEACVDMLEKLATSNDFSVRNNAQQALDAVRARL